MNDYLALAVRYARALALAATAYLFGAFCAWSTDPGDWPAFWRYLVGVGGVIAFFGGLTS